jgi:hypothetical protein
VNSPPPKPEVILANFFAEPTVLLVPITSREETLLKYTAKRINCKILRHLMRQKERRHRKEKV